MSTISIRQVYRAIAALLREARSFVPSSSCSRTLLKNKSLRENGFLIVLVSAPVWVAAASLIAAAWFTSQPRHLLASSLAAGPANLTPNDPKFSIQWNLPAVGAPAAWDLTTGTSDVIIAVVDSGVEVSHPELISKTLPGWDFVDNDPDPRPTSDSNNAFGTGIAGIAAAQTNNGQFIAGIAWGARLLPIRVFNRSTTYPFDPPRTSVGTVATGIRYAADHGAQVVLLAFAWPNLTTGEQQTLQAAIDYAYAAGALVVAAAGDHGADDPNPNPTTYPAALNHVLAVAGTSFGDSRWFASERGNYIALAAPASPITTIDSATNSMLSADSTAFAAAHVAGAAALVWTINPDLTSDAVRNILESTAHDLGTSGRDELYGFGRLDILAALRATPHKLQLTPASLQFAKSGLYIVPAQQTITNTTTSALSWQAQKDVPWLALDGPTGGVPSFMTVSVLTSQVPFGACGTLTGHITVNSTLPASTGSQIIPVDLQLPACPGGTATRMPTVTATATSAATATSTPTRTPTARFTPTLTASPAATFTPTSTTTPTATATSTPLPADLAIQLIAPATVEPGELVTYTLVYTNYGPGPARAAVITNTLPSGIDFTGIAIPPGTAHGAGTFGWDLGDLASGATGEITLVGRAQTGLTAGTLLVDTASAATSAVDRLPTNNMASHTLTVVVADLEVRQIAPKMVLPGQTMTYTLLYANPGSAPARAVILTDTLPLSVTFQSATPSAVSVGGGRLRWNLGSLAPGEQRSVLLTVVADPGLPEGAVLHNVAEASTQSREQNTDNNRSTFDSTGTLTQAADVYLQQTAAPQVYPGELITYTLAYGNTGNLTAQGVVISDTLPLSVTLVSASANHTNTGRNLVWSIPPLQPGMASYLTITVKAPDAVGVRLVNTASITTTSAEADITNNARQAVTDVRAGVPATVTLAPETLTLVVGPEHGANITATVRDARGYLVDDTPVTFEISTGRGFINPTVVQTRNGFASTRYLAGIRPGLTRVVARAGSLISTNSTSITLLPGDPAQVFLAAAPATSTAGTPADITTIVRDAYGNSVADNTAVALTTSLGQLVPASGFTSGGTFFSRLYSTVAGVAQVRGTAGSVVSEPPLAVTFQPGPAAQVVLNAFPVNIPVEGGTSQVEARVTDSYTNVVTTTHTVYFETSRGIISPASAPTEGGRVLATLAAGNLAGTAAITATVPGLKPGYARVDLQPPDLEVTLDVNPQTPVMPGQLLTYTVRYLNRGMSMARGVSISDPLLPELSDLNMIAASPAITYVTGTSYTWTVRDLAPGDGGIITLTARLRTDYPWGAGRTVTNLVTINTQTDEMVRSNNQASANVLVVTADLQVFTELLAGGDRRPGGWLRYRIGYNNLNTMPAANVRITDTLPEWTSFSYETAEFAPGLRRITPNSAPIQVWTIDDPVASGNFKFLITVRIQSDAPGGAPVVNHVQIGTTTPEGNLFNNYAESPEMTLEGLNLSINQSAPDTVKPQRSITYTLRYEYRGSDPASNVVVTDILPQGVDLVIDPVRGTTPSPTTQNGRTLTWSLGTLNSLNRGGAIRVVGRVQSSVKSGAILTNTATIGTASNETYLPDNLSQISTRVIPDEPITPTVQIASQVDVRASTPVTITVTDDYGNPAPDGTTITLTSTLGIMNPSQVTTRNGLATATYQAGTRAGTAMITARVGRYSRQVTTQVWPGPPARLSVSVPQAVEVMASSWVTAEVRDAWDNLVADGSVVTFSTNLGQVGNGATATASTAKGIARVTFTAGTRAGRARIEAAINGVLASAEIVVTPGPPRYVTLQAAQTILTAGGLPVALTITVADQFNNLIDGVPVTLSATRGTLSQDASITSAGVLNATFTPPTVAGDVEVKASVPAPGGTVEGSIVFEIWPGAAANISLSANPSQLTVGQGLYSTLAITVTDAFGNRVQDTVVVNLATTLGRLAANTLQVRNGTATTTLEPGQRTGLATVTASMGLYTAVTNVRFLADEPAHVTLDVRPASLIADGAMTATLAITVTDRFLNRVEDYTPVALTANLVEVPPVVETSGGMARVPVRAGTKVGTATIHVTAGNISTTTQLSLLPGPPYQLAISADPPSLIVDRTPETTLQVLVRDRFQNPVADGITVTFSTNLGVVDPVESGTSGGVASTRLLAGRVAGTAHVIASAGTAYDAALVPILGGDPFTITLQVAPIRLVADNRSTASITATLTDAYGNRTRDGMDVFFSLADPGLGRLNPAQALTRDGVVTATLTASLSIGATPLVVASGGRAATQLIQFVPGAPYSMTVLAQPTLIQVGSSEAITIEVLVQDRWLRPVEDGTLVTFSTNLGNFAGETSSTAETRHGRAMALLSPGQEPGVAQVDLSAGSEARTSLQVLFYSARLYLPLISSVFPVP